MGKLSIKITSGIFIVLVVSISILIESREYSASIIFCFNSSVGLSAKTKTFNESLSFSVTTSIQ
jgi:hypothetical protein